jgi:3-keto-disaccharide hydrolase
MHASSFRISALFTAILAFAAGLWGLAADDAKAPPAGATVLFDGKSLEGWTGKNGQPATWKVEDGYMEVVPGKGDIRTAKEFGPDFKLHVEFWLPLMADKHGQARANSGVYLQGRYEVQVLDSYMNETYPDGVCGALYGILKPSKNANKPPEQWQTYDLTFKSPRVDGDGKVTTKGELTVVQNGETIIDKGQFDKVTGGAMDEKMGYSGPIRLQDHGCKVRFRNIWLQPIE